MTATAAAWVSAGVAFCALVAVIVFGVLNLRQARRGPVKSPRWSLEHATGQRYELVLAEADARDVKVEAFDADLVNGVTGFEVFAVGQRASYLLTTGLGSKHPRVRVTWAGKNGARPEWNSDLPRRG